MQTTRKATGFKSLLLNCWNIAQIISISKMSTSFSRLTPYSVRFVKKINVLGLRNWFFTGKFTNFLQKQKQPVEVFCKKGVLKYFAIFTWKHLCWSLFAGLQACNFIKRLRHRCFPVNIAKFLRISISKNIWKQH